MDYITHSDIECMAAVHKRKITQHSWLDTSGFNRFPKRFLAFAKEELYTVLTE